MQPAEYTIFPQWNIDHKLYYNTIDPYAQTAGFIGTSTTPVGILTHWDSAAPTKYWRVDIEVIDNNAAFNLLASPFVVSDQMPVQQWAPPGLVPSDGRP
jgi:hypothetical protein